MLYDLSKEFETNQARSLFEHLIGKRVLIELKERKPKRSLNQNAYLHVLFSLFGINFGYTIEESKTLIKRELGYFYTKNGQKFLSHTSEMDSGQLTTFIEKFRNYSSGLGCYLPSADEYKCNYAYFDRQIIDNEIYLK